MRECPLFSEAVSLATVRSDDVAAQHMRSSVQSVQVHLILVNDCAHHGRLHHRSLMATILAAVRLG